MNEMMLSEGKGSGLDKSEIKMRIKGRGITFLLVNPSRGPKEKDGACDPSKNNCLHTRYRPVSLF